MSPVGFEPTISEDARALTYALDRAAAETGVASIRNIIYYELII